MSADACGSPSHANTRSRRRSISPGRDAIKVLEDTDGDGRADKITTFADGLNIPIGIYPYKGGAIAWSIPNIWHFQDTNGDGKADKARRFCSGPLGWERDTHGMNASFRRGYDGWIYITHGFNNNSTVKGRDGSEIKLNSGNTYRIRPDGSRVEPHTWGQVNPFGLTFDAFGNLYSADCHSSPIYQLLRGAYYPSFGKPDDGLGFAPVLMQHSHNSTAIGGIAYYEDDQWPAEFRDNIFVGNVMTSRVNRDLLRFAGSSPSAKELPDFLTSDDPWFRPVDLQFGPDGALYVADFYNRIIGHYEVPLTHPGRDRERGRIWRVSYKQGKRPQQPLTSRGSQRTNWSRNWPAQI
jgi:glucose/arabinose dehydrogenase